MERVIISGGGTGGHIYPALAVATQISKLYPQAEILFVGASDRMEMDIVPRNGYRIVGLEIKGISRSSLWKNLQLPWMLWKAFLRSRALLKEFRPQIVAGFGGYASAPMCLAAWTGGVPVVLQEQNSYAGVTNRLLGRIARRIFVAYDGMNAYFPARRIQFTGNPMRADIRRNDRERQNACNFFRLDPEKRTLVVLGGSLGARTLNAGIAGLSAVLERHEQVQVLWQTGKSTFDEWKTSDMARHPRVCVIPFTDRMDLAYAVADLVVARAGALTISELCLCGLPVVLVPSPNVAEDHQTRNARYLSDRGAALLIPDNQFREQAASLLELIRDDKKLSELSDRIRTLATPDAAKQIVAAMNEIVRA